jgi:hypothetical protein
MVPECPCLLAQPSNDAPQIVMRAIDLVNLGRATASRDSRLLFRELEGAILSYDGFYPHRLRAVPIGSQCTVV